MQVLKEEVLPVFEKKPEQWTQMMVNSILDTREAFSAERMIRDYCQNLYECGWK